MADKTEIEAAARAAAAGNTQTVTDLRGGFVVVPDGYALHDVQDLQAKPNRIRTDYRFRDTDSLAAYLNVWGGPETVLFSSPEQQKICAVLDHHLPQDPSHGSHRATFCGVWGRHYERWRKISGKVLSQVEAGAFLEERATDVVVPDAASIMDMVMTFDATKKVTFRQSDRLHDGQRQLTYTEENEVRGNVILPERMTILVEVLEGQKPERINIRVRYRIEDGRLTFLFEIHDQADAERVAFDRAEAALEAALTIKPPMLRMV